MPALSLNFLQANKTTIPFTLNSHNIEWVKPFLVDHGRGIEGAQIRTTSGDLFVVTETYTQVRAMMGDNVITEENPVVKGDLIVEGDVKARDVVSSPADRVFGKAATTSAGIADTTDLKK